MAIFHFSAKVIGRSSGRSAVAAAAYRAGERLHDERIDRTHDFTNKAGVLHSEVILPKGVPEAFADRATLWNAVEAAEKRKDAQLAREVEFALPRELSKKDNIKLARAFVKAEFVERGMIADLNVHWDIGEDGKAKPHAHVMLTMREIGREATKDGFGAKVRDWNKTALIEQWRERWADQVNRALAEREIDARVDHRSLEAQGIALEPQDKIGPAASRIGGRGLEAERIEEHRAIAQRNGERVIANPAIALDAITHSQATFTRRDLAAFVHRHSDGKEQFDAAYSAVRGSPDLIALGEDGRGQDRFTSRAMIETEQRLHRAADEMAQRANHSVNDVQRNAAFANVARRGLVLSGEQKSAFEHVTKGKGLAVVVGYAGTGKSAMLGVAREAWESAGYNVRGAALSGIAAEGLENGSGIASRTIASLEHQWGKGREQLTSRDVLVIDEAGMVGTRQMERVLSHAAKAGAKLVLVGDQQQLQAIEAGAAFRAIHERHGGAEISEVRRQLSVWQQDATKHLATGRTGEAISKTLSTIGNKPAIELTPEDIAAQIKRASLDMLRDASDLFRQGRKDFDSATGQLNAIVGRVRTEDEQKRQTWRFAGLGLAFGILLWSIIPGTITRAMPESWHWPERMARKAVDEPTILEAGIRLIRSQNPDAWEQLAATQSILSANREALDRCKERARREERPVSCTISIAL